MTLQARKTADKDLTIFLSDTFDFNCVEDFRQAYQSQEDCKIKTYVIDFKDTQYMDSSALGMLINLQKFAQKNNSEVKLINPSTNIRKILSISRFDKKFTIE